MEADSRSFSQNMHHLLWNPNISLRVYKILSFDPILNQM
jgi:hypothetical protein